jgi:hypothetical protein
VSAALFEEIAAYHEIGRQLGHLTASELSNDLGGALAEGRAMLRALHPAWRGATVERALLRLVLAHLRLPPERRVNGHRARPHARNGELGQGEFAFARA